MLEHLVGERQIRGVWIGFSGNAQGRHAVFGAELEGRRIPAIAHQQPSLRRQQAGLDRRKDGPRAAAGSGREETQPKRL